MKVKFIKILSILLTLFFLSVSFPVTAAPLRPEESGQPIQPQNIDAGELLSGIVVESVAQNTYNPGESNNVTVAVSLRNSGENEVEALEISVAVPSSDISVIGNESFDVDLPADSTKSISIRLLVPGSYAEGNYSVDLNLSYTDRDGSVKNDKRTIFVYINRGMGAGAIAENKTSKPQLILGGYDIGGDTVISGSEFTLKFNLKNTSMLHSVKNLKIVAKSQENAFIPKFGKSNQIYIEKIDAGFEKEIVYELKTAHKKTGDYQMDFMIEYEDEFSEAYSETITIWLPLSNNSSIDVDSLVVPETAAVGEKVPINVRFTNTGDDDIKDVKVAVEGDIEGGRMEISAGTLKAGQSTFVDCSIVFTQAGEKTLDILFVCTDKSDNKFEVESATVTVDVSKEIISDLDMGIEKDDNQASNSSVNNENETDSLNPFWFIFIAAIIAGIAAGTLYFINKKKKNDKF